MSSRLLPPQSPCSEPDVASFAALVIHLRSQPELARENEKLLNAEALADLTEGVRQFQHAHLGRHARAMQWPMVRIPDEIFRDRSRSGPLFTALLAAYREKNSSSWRTFDLPNPKRYDDNMDILRRMEKDLVAAGYLRRPVIYFDDTVPKERLPKLQEIVEQYQGTVVTDPTKASHVVAHDPEIDAEDFMAGEEKREAEGEDPEKMYLRTVTVANSDIADEQDKVAMVHWWYWPSSYDEWMPASDVSQTIEPEATRTPGMPWVVGYKFIRDVDKHNEWGNEADYAIPDFQTKVALYKQSSQAQHADAKRRGSRASATSKQLAGAGSIFAKRDRRSGTGMNPRSILTGFYDEETGARIRRVVHDGALRVPVQASIFQQTSIEAIVSNWPQKERNRVLKALSQARNHDLPGVNTLVRPSLDDSKGSTLVVTELSASSSGTTVSRNVTIALKKPKTERIRGGGGDEGDGTTSSDAPMDVDMGNTATQPTIADPSSLPANGNGNGDGNGNANGNDVADVQMEDTSGAAPEAASTAPTVAQPNIGGQELPSSAPKPEPSGNPLATTAAAPSLDAQASAPAPAPASAAVPQSTEAPTPNSAPAPAPVPSNGTTNPPISTTSNTDQVEEEEKKADSAPSAQQNANANGVKEASTTPTLHVSAQSVEGDAAPKEEEKEEEKKDEQPASVPSSHESDDGESKKEPDDLPPADAPPTVESLSDAAKKKASTDEAPVSKTTVPPVDLPSWYDPEKVSDLEKRLLPEWFNESASHRTEATYIQTREKLISVTRTNPDKFLTATAVRRCVVGDAGSLLRLHELLTHWRIINAFAAGESVPVAPDTRYQHDEMESRKRPIEDTFWTEGRKEMLAKLVVENSNKKRKADPNAMESDEPKKEGQVDIDWKAIAVDVGGGVSSTECQRAFLSLPLAAPSSGTNAKPSHGSMSVGTRAAREEILKDLVKDVRPEVIEAATKAALQTTGDIQEAQKGALLGSIAAKAEERAAAEEENANELLLELLNQRMKKLENRVSLLDEVEGMLEAERVSLELERRDLYTARCRHWFGGGN